MRVGMRVGVHVDVRVGVHVEETETDGCLILDFTVRAECVAAARPCSEKRT